MDLFKVELKLTCKSGTIVSSHLPRRNVYQSQPYIPASVMNGSLLTSLMEITCERDGDCRNCKEKETCDFQQVVLPGFRGVTPGLPACPNENCEGSQKMAAAPVTFEYCKSCQSITKEHRTISDNTLTWLEGKRQFCIDNPEHGYSNKSFRGMICLNCRAELERSKISLRTCVAIDSETGTAAEGQLYSYETIVAGSEFTGEVTASEEVIKELTGINSLFTGRGASRGFGWVSLEVRRKVPVEDIIAVKQRMIETNFDITGGWLVTCVKTPVFQVEQDRTSGMIVSRPYLETIGDDWKLEKSRGYTVDVTGWSYASDFQKPRFTAAGPGTVFAYKAKTASPDFRLLAEKLVTNQLAHSQGLDRTYDQLDTWRLGNE